MITRFLLICYELAFFSYDGELQLIHYKSTYANISEAVAEASMDSLAIVSIFIQEQSEFDQFRVRDSEAIYNLRMAALKLSQAHAGPTVRSVELSINLGDFTNTVR